MKILITGKNSYVGKNIKAWLEKNENYKVDELDLKNEEWIDFNFQEYQCIIHVAAIVHQAKKNTSWETYKTVNTLIPYQVALKAKQEGVRQFVFLSTMGIYGQEKKLPRGNIIDSNTPISPNSYYGRSKYEAELLINRLNDYTFKICIIRPPSIYGKDCPGNYFMSFIKIAKYLPVFPKVYTESKQSFLYIDNLSELIRLAINQNSSGIFMPQDGLPVSAVELIETISNSLNKKMWMSKTLGLLMRVFSKMSLVNKVYGGISYSNNLSDISIGNYKIIPFCEAVRIIIRGD